MMNTPLLLKNVLHNGSTVSIRIRNGIYETIAPHLTHCDGEEVFDCGGRLAILPAFYNTHTHAAMSLLRGYADDYPLFQWLTEYVWPLEQHLQPDDVYQGTRLAILEMIRTGTVFFNDMYWFQEGAVRAVEEMGIRAMIGMLHLKNADAAGVHNDYLKQNRKNFSHRIQVCHAPHSIYTLDTEHLRQVAEQVDDDGMLIHIHLAETKKEFEDCLNEHNMTPARYLDSMGLLRKNTLLAHAIYLNDEDIKLIKERGCVPAHIPASNMKLASGRFPMERYLRAGCPVALGTDSACSNNNLSMLEEMKLAALLAKLGTENPECCPAHTVYDMATVNGAAAFGLHAGVIAEGYLADGILIRTDVPAMIPTYHLHSNLVYAAEPSCIDSVICDGKFLMKHGVIEGEQEILAAANESAHKLVERVRK